MTIIGLSNNYYLINNKNFVTINAFANPIKYLEVKASNNFTSKTETLRFYPINGSCVFDLNPLVKSTFNNPNLDVATNLNEVVIEFKTKSLTNTFVTQTITKFFIRGGNQSGLYPSGLPRLNYLNNLDIIPALLSENIPNFGSVQQEYEIRNGVYNPIVSPQFNEKINFECNGYRVKFLNQYGTYSDWGFDAYEIKNTTRSLDMIERQNSFQDLGVTVKTEIEVRGKVPERYNEIIKHLLFSPEIYNVDYDIKLKLKSESHIENVIDKVFDYKISFELQNEINPSLLC
jgi:hypothetical protein